MAAPGWGPGEPVPAWLSPATAVRLGTLCLLVLTLWAALAEVDVVVSAPAAARPSGGTVTLRAPGSRQVRQVLAAAGDTVAAGQVIVLLDDTTAESRWRSATVALQVKRQLRATLQTVAQLLDSDAPLSAGMADDVRLRLVEQRSRMAKLDGELTAMETELSALLDRAATSRQLLVIKEERYRAAQTAFQRGALSRFDLLRVRQEAVAQRADAAANAGHADVLRARIGAHRNARREIASGDRQALAESIDSLKVEVAQLQAARAEAAELRAESRIVAPIAGVVEQLQLAAGEVLERGAVVAVIVPAHQPVVFEARVAPWQAAFLHPLQSCRIKLDALPFARYGALPCTVELLSQDVVAADRGPGYYLVKVRPATQRLQADGQPLRLQPGATASVDIIAGRRTVLSFVTEPLRRFAAESLREQ
ncbi:MAG: HlyD family efflux transporter periplasmic adaptor subunit [Pseudomonadales bacterium]